MQHFLIVPIGLVMHAVPLFPGGAGIGEVGLRRAVRLAGWSEARRRRWARWCSASSTGPSAWSAACIYLTGMLPAACRAQEPNGSHKEPAELVLRRSVNRLAQH